MAVRINTLAGIIFCCSLIGACTASPPPRLIHEDGTTIVRLMTSAQTGAGFTHPAVVSLEQMQTVLLGLRVERRDSLIPRLLAGTPESLPAFSPGDIAQLAPVLCKAFAAARDDEVVTFYRRISDTALGLGITSGGMLKQRHLLYVYLANFRTKPAEAMGISTTYAIDPVDTPLLALRPGAFHLGYEKEEALQPSDRQWWTWDGVPNGQVVVIRLPLLQPETNRFDPRR